MTKTRVRPTADLAAVKMTEKPASRGLARVSRRWLLGNGWSPDFSRCRWTILLAIATCAACVIQSVIGWDLVKSAVGFVPAAAWAPSSWFATLPGQSLPVAATWFSYVFPHMNWFHMGSNVMALLVFGSVVEPMIGTARFAAVTIAGTVLGVFGLAAVHPLGTEAIAGGSLLVCTIIGVWFAALSQTWWRKHSLLTVAFEIAALGSLLAWLVLRSPPSHVTGFMGVLWHVPSFMLGWFAFRLASAFHALPVVDRNLA